ncbi:hypothetical protein ILUMI_01148 [Ignelater luminosus]|uniref:Uncharacterized protein n=1 Tax=Ignelater luminosus TaxID=2038154 RepID=A0A8K0DKU8_IGNLU|nr:hypothetical protein ILUMI_01148 [Ignelater luminosus]
MKFLVVLALAVVAAVARPEQLVSVNQDTLGNYDLKYIINGISRAENRNINGDVTGAYSYYDPHGILRSTSFTSGVHGYHAVGSDIPLPVQDTPEVAYAKAAHLSALHAAKLSLPPAPLEVQFPELFAPHPHAIGLPAPVHHLAPAIPAFPGFIHGGIPETPEVIAARAEHFAAHAAAARSHGFAHGFAHGPHF